MENDKNLEIRLLGGFEFRIGRGDIGAALSPCDLRLLAYLSWKCGERVGRERLIDQLWSGLPPDRAMRALNTSLWRIRRAIRANGHKARDYICTNGTNAALLRAPLRVSDAVAVENLALHVLGRSVDDADDKLLAEIERIVDDHPGSFLPDCYDDWCFVPREVLRNRYAVLQEFLVLALMHRRKWREAIVFAQCLVADDPMQENAHQWLIQSHLALGDRMRAKAQYDRCAALLNVELGVKPLPETAALLNGVVTIKEPRGHTMSQRLRGAIKSLDAARDAILGLEREL